MQPLGRLWGRGVMEPTRQPVPEQASWYSCHPGPAVRVGLSHPMVFAQLRNAPHDTFLRMYLWS